MKRRKGGEGKEKADRLTRVKAILFLIQPSKVEATL